MAETAERLAHLAHWRASEAARKASARLPPHQLDAPHHPFLTDPTAREREQLLRTLQPSAPPAGAADPFPRLPHANEWEVELRLPTGSIRVDMHARCASVRRGGPLAVCVHDENASTNPTGEWSAAARALLAEGWLLAVPRWDSWAAGANPTPSQREQRVAAVIDALRLRLGGEAMPSPPGGESLAPPGGESLAPPGGESLTTPCGESLALPGGESLAPPCDCLLAMGGAVPAAVAYAASRPTRVRRLVLIAPAAPAAARPPPAETLGCPVLLCAAKDDPCSDGWERTLRRRGAKGASSPVQVALAPLRCGGKLACARRACPALCVWGGRSPASLAPSVRQVVFAPAWRRQQFAPEFVAPIVSFANGEVANAAAAGSDRCAQS